MKLNDMLMEIDLAPPPEPEPFYGTKPPPIRLQTERPVHRMMANLAILGHSNLEIADQTGYTPQEVSIVLRQPHIQDWMSREIERKGGNKIQLLLESEAETSVRTLVTLRDSAATPAAVRRGCSTDILDRVFGKPVTRVEETKAPLRDIGDVRKEIQLIEAELKIVDSKPNEQNGNSK